MDAILQKFEGMQWSYATGDAQALKDSGGAYRCSRSQEGVALAYSDLVREVTFDLPNLEKPRTIDVTDWQELDRAIVGSFLGFISMRSYERAKFFSSALVVSKMRRVAGRGIPQLASGTRANTKSAKP